MRRLLLPLLLLTAAFSPSAALASPNASEEVRRDLLRAVVLSDADASVPEIAEKAGPLAGTYLMGDYRYHWDWWLRCVIAFVVCLFAFMKSIILNNEKKISDELSAAISVPSFFLGIASFIWGATMTPEVIAYQGYAKYAVIDTFNLQGADLGEEYAKLVKDHRDRTDRSIPDEAIFSRESRRPVTQPQPVKAEPAEAEKHPIASADAT